MKKSFISLLCIFALTAFSTNIVFAAPEPIPGIDIIVKRKPPKFRMPEVVTDASGKFSFKLEEGIYELTLSYAQITKILSGLNKNYLANPATFSINLMFTGQSPDGNIFDRWGNLTKTPTNIIINRKTGAISINVPKGGGTISGTLNYKPKPKPKPINILDPTDTH